MLSARPIRGALHAGVLLSKLPVLSWTAAEAANLVVVFWIYIRFAESRRTIEFWRFLRFCQDYSFKLIVEFQSDLLINAQPNGKIVRAGCWSR